VTAPVLSSFTATAVETTKAKLSVTSDTKNGICYLVVVPTAATAPNATQVMDGQDGAGNSATWANSMSVWTIDSYLAPGPSGLTSATAYKAYAMHRNAGLENSSVASVSFTTG
jgi:hypothetical protein